MILIGLTGNIASGKTEVAKMLAERGATIIDADELASWALVGNVLNAINCIGFAPEVMQTCMRVAHRLQTLVRR